MHEAARIMGVSRQAFGQSYRRHVPAADVREQGRGRPVLIRVRGLIDSLIAFHVEQDRLRRGDDDALLQASADSPALERLRVARARLCEMDLEQRQRTHMDLAAMERGLLHLLTMLRDTMEQARRKPGGNDIVDALEETLTEFASGLDAFFRNPVEAKGGGDA